MQWTFVPFHGVVESTCLLAANNTAGLAQFKLCQWTLVYCKHSISATPGARAASRVPIEGAGSGNARRIASRRIKSVEPIVASERRTV